MADADVFGMTPGIKTSEFWLSFASIVALVALAIQGEIDGEWAAAAILGTGGVYTGSRAAVKKAVGGAQAALEAVDALDVLDRVSEVEGQVASLGKATSEQTWGAPE